MIPSTAARQTDRTQFFVEEFCVGQEDSPRNWPLRTTFVFAIGASCCLWAVIIFAGWLLV